MRFLVILILGLAALVQPAHAAPPVCDAAREGTIIYNKDSKLVQFCNGVDWIGMVAQIGGTGDTLDDLSCASGEVPEWNGAAWVCGASGTGLWTDSGSGYLLYAGDKGVKLANITGMGMPQMSVGDLGCSANEILKWDGDSWECAADDAGALADNSVTNVKMADDAIGIAELSATGTPSTTTYLRGDGQWAAPSISSLAWSALTGVPAGFADGTDDSVLQGMNDTGPCTAGKNGLIKFNPADSLPWQYCDGGTTSWLPFRLPQCQNDGTGACSLSLSRSTDDPDFLPASICSGKSILGVSGTAACPPPDITPPVWTTAAGTVATISTSAALSATVVGTDNSGFVAYAKQSGDAWISVNGTTGALTGTAPGSAGTASVVIRLSDAAGNFVDRTFNVVVQVPPDTTPPAWTTAAGSIATVEIGAALSTSVVATDAGGTITYTKQAGSAAWINVSSAGAVTGTAPMTTGPATLIVRATDPSNNFTDRTFTVNVEDTTNPVWTTAAGTVATINTSAALSASVVGTDNSGSVTYAKQSGDAWISVNGTSGALTGTAPGSAGTSSITVRLSDAAGNFVDRTFNVVVNAAACTGAIGTTCADGSKLLGTHPTLGGTWYATNVNQAVSTWATVNVVNSGAQSLTNGFANHQWIVANRTLSKYPAFQVCENLTLHGKTDWYLPSRDELNVLYVNRTAIGGFGTGSFWSSSESSSEYARYRYFPDGIQGNNYKGNTLSVRCVRRS